MAKARQSEYEKYFNYLQKGDTKQSEGKYKEAMEYFVKALPFSRDGEAEYAIGCLYYNGQGVEQNYDEDIKWVFKAARKRHPEAMRVVGCWYDGDMGEQHVNRKRAARWLYRAAIVGSETASYRLACLYYYGKGIEKDERKGEYRALAAAGKEQYHVYDLLGIIYGERFEKEGNPLDFCRSEFWFKKAIASDEEEYLEHDRYNLAELYRQAKEKNRV